MWAKEPDDVLADLVEPDLAAAFESAAAEHHDALTRSLVAALEVLRFRGVPLRRVSRFSRVAARLQFADGTALLVRADGTRRVGLLAVAVVRQRPVVITDLHVAGGLVHAVLRWDNHFADVEVLGRDQVD